MIFVYVVVILHEYFFLVPFQQLVFKETKYSTQRDMFGSQDEHVLETFKGCPVRSLLSMADEGRRAVNQARIFKENLCYLSTMIIPCSVGNPPFQTLID